MGFLKEMFEELQMHKDYDRKYINVDQFKILVKWCKDNFIGIKTINNKVGSSYGLKHIFEETANGFYIQNSDFKLAMEVAGFKSENKGYLNKMDAIAKYNVNLHYAISSKSPAFKKR